MMLWLRTYTTSYMLSAMFGVSKSTDENVINELTLILFANLKSYWATTQKNVPLDKILTFNETSCI